MVQLFCSICVFSSTHTNPFDMKNLTLFLFILLFSATLYGQVEDNEQQFEFDYTIPSLAFGDDRMITVYLPPTYYDSPDLKYTVSYVLDGHFDPFIDLAVKTIEYNAYMYNYTRTIVVGIHAKNRGWEFSAPVPGDEHDAKYKGGRAAELQKHFKNEVFPLVDSIYGERLQPFRNLIGHSSGGAFALWSLFSDEKDLFDGFLAISPGIRKDSEYILENAERRLANGEVFNKFLYCSSGTVGEREEIFGGAVARLDSLLTVYPQHGLIWKTSKFEGMDHWTCVPPSINAGMVELTRAFRVDEFLFHEFANNDGTTMMEQIEAFYENREKVYGFTEIPSYRYLKSIGWELMEKGKHKAALDMYDWGLKKHGNNYTLRRARAILLLEMGQKKEAYTAFEDVLQGLETIKSEMSEEQYSDRKAYLLKKQKECELQE